MHKSPKNVSSATSVSLKQLISSNVNESHSANSSPDTCDDLKVCRTKGECKSGEIGVDMPAEASRLLSRVERTGLVSLTGTLSSAKRSYDEFVSGPEAFENTCLSPTSAKRLRMQSNKSPSTKELLRSSVDPNELWSLDGKIRRLVGSAAASIDDEKAYSVLVQIVSDVQRRNFTKGRVAETVKALPDLIAAVPEEKGNSIVASITELDAEARRLIVYFSRLLVKRPPASVISQLASKCSELCAFLKATEECAHDALEVTTDRLDELTRELNLRMTSDETAALEREMLSKYEPMVEQGYRQAEIVGVQLARSLRLTSTFLHKYLLYHKKEVACLPEYAAPLDVLVAESSVAPLVELEKRVKLRTTVEYPRFMSKGCSGKKLSESLFPNDVHPTGGDTFPLSAGMVPKGSVIGACHGHCPKRVRCSTATEPASDAPSMVGNCKQLEPILSGGISHGSSWSPCGGRNDGIAIDADPRQQCRHVPSARSSILRLAMLHQPLCGCHTAPEGNRETPARYDVAMTALHEVEAVCAGNAVVERVSQLISRDDVLRVHSKGYIDTLEKVVGEVRQDAFAVLHSNSPCDNPCPEFVTFVSPDSIKAAYGAAAVAKRGVDVVLRGEACHAFCCVRPPGHSVGRDGCPKGASGQGCCLLNNVAIAAIYTKEEFRIERVAVVDFDVHHGAGTQDILRGRQGFLFVSIHVYAEDEDFFPMTGGSDESAEGVLNIPVERYLSRSRYVDVFRRSVLPALQAFRPEVLLLSAGFDGHHDDPSNGLLLLDDDFYAITADLVGVAEALRCPIVSVLEGGYDTKHKTNGFLHALRAHLMALAGKPARSWGSSVCANRRDGSESKSSSAVGIPPASCESERSRWWNPVLAEAGKNEAQVAGLVRDCLHDAVGKKESASDGISGFQ